MKGPTNLMECQRKLYVFAKSRSDFRNFNDFSSKKKEMHSSNNPQPEYEHPNHVFPVEQSV